MRDVREEIGPRFDARGRNMLSPINQFRHVKSGGVYKFIDVGRNEADLTPVVIYRNAATGWVWVRPVSEWLDGRFEVFNGDSQ